MLPWPGVAVVSWQHSWLVLPPPDPPLLKVGPLNEMPPPPPAATRLGSNPKLESSPFWP
jgi:hypothetical protein